MVGEVPTMFVWAANETYRKVLFHPVTHIRFPNDINEPAMWPQDQYTWRELRDGSILDHAPDAAPTQQAAAPKAKAKKDDSDA